MSPERRTKSETVTRLARNLLESGSYTGELLRQRGRVGKAIAVSRSDGVVQSWLVPVLVDDLLAGFFRTDPKLGHWQWSGFQRSDDALLGCPRAVTWLDAADIQRRAASLARPDEIAQSPVLSYDRVPDRLAWAVQLIAADGGVRTVYVAGHAVWPATDSDQESYNGS